MASDSEVREWLFLGVIYLILIRIFGGVGRFMFREVYGTHSLPIGFLIGVVVGLVVVSRLQRRDIPHPWLKFGTFAVVWYMLSWLIAVTAMTWAAPFVPVDLRENFIGMTALLFVLGLIWYLGVKWPNYVGRWLDEKFT